MRGSPLWLVPRYFPGIRGLVLLTGVKSPCPTDQKSPAKGLIKILGKTIAGQGSQLYGI